MKRLYRVYLLSMVFVLTITMMMPSSFAVDDMWTVANNCSVDLYSQIVKISTVLARPDVRRRRHWCEVHPTTNTRSTRRGTGSGESGSPGS